MAALVPACHRVWTARLSRPGDLDDLDTSAPYAKCHMEDGEVYVLERWSVDGGADTISGTGLRYDVDRREVERGPFVLDRADVALVETNRPQEFVHVGLIVMGVVTIASLGLTAACLANPKACFGSCPTFYPDDPAAPRPEAEGFSAAVARTLEETDVDALPASGAREGGGAVDVWMRNEALETHVVRSVRLLAAPRPAGGRVLRAGGRFHPVEPLAAPARCRSLAGDCTQALAALDGVELSSRTDGRDLGSREVVELELAGFAGTRAPGELGLAIAGRNTLLHTFLFYQGLAYLGRRAGDFVRRLETGGAGLARLASVQRLVGDMDVQVLAPGGWTRVGSFSEVGPIARDVHLVTLPAGLPPGELRVRLEATRGAFRLDHVGLVAVGAPVTPVPLPPEAVERDGGPAPSALAALLDPAAHLVTYPGDEYRLRFRLPAGPQEVFLESTGYYYEWLRAEWLAEEDPAAAAAMLADPADALRRLAPAYAAREEELERAFWGSRVGPRSPEGEANKKARFLRAKRGPAIGPPRAGAD